MQEVHTELRFEIGVYMKFAKVKKLSGDVQLSPTNGTL